MENSIVFYEGYCKALRDLHIYLNQSQSSFRADRKRNNVKNMIWLLECILENVDAFARYGADLPIYFREAGKRLEYYVDYSEWPIHAGQNEAL